MGIRGDVSTCMGAIAAARAAIARARLCFLLMVIEIELISSVE